MNSYATVSWFSNSISPAVSAPCRKSRSGISAMSALIRAPIVWWQNWKIFWHFFSQFSSLNKLKIQQIYKHGNKIHYCFKNIHVLYKKSWLASLSKISLHFTSSLACLYLIASLYAAKTIGGSVNLILLSPPLPKCFLDVFNICNNLKKYKWLYQYLQHVEKGEKS